MRYFGTDMAVARNVISGINDSDSLFRPSVSDFKTLQVQHGLGKEAMTFQPALDRGAEAGACRSPAPRLRSRIPKSGERRPNECGCNATLCFDVTWLWGPSPNPPNGPPAYPSLIRIENVCHCLDSSHMPCWNTRACHNGAQSRENAPL